MNGSVLTLGDGLHELRKRLIGRSPIQCLPGPVVQQIGDGVQRILLMDTQIGALGQELPQQPVGVLAACTLPGAVRVAEVHTHVRGLCQLPVTGHLLALVIGERLAHGSAHLVELGGEGRKSRFGCGIRHLAQQHQPGAALDKNSHCGLVACALDQIPLPMPRHQSVMNLGRSHMDADHLGNLSSPVLARRAGSAAAAPLAQQGQSTAS